MTRRRYKDPMLQRLYDHFRAHPPIRDGRRHHGASHRSAFWRGVDGIERDGRSPYVRGSQCQVCYMAGQDSRVDPAVKTALLTPVGAGVWT